MDVWSHIYIGKIYDLLDQRTRAVNEYQLAQHTNDDTAGAQEELAKFLKKPYSPDGSAEAAAAPADSATPKAAAPGATAASGAAAAPADASADNKPVLKKRDN